VYRKSRVRRMVQKSLSDEENKLSINGINSLANTKWNSKYHAVFAPKHRKKFLVP